MGLSLQLLVYLARVLDENGMADSSHEAKRLEAGARHDYPELFLQTDPNNDHTRILAVAALGLGLQGASGREQDAAIANALRWILKKELTPRSMGALSKQEQQILAMAQDALEAYEQMEEQAETLAWQPRTQSVIVQPAAADPMLAPDVSPEHMGQYVRDHGLLVTEDKVAPGDSSMAAAEPPNGPAMAPPPESDALLIEEPTEHKPDDASFLIGEPLENTAATAPARTAAPPALIEMTGYTTETPTPDGAAATSTPRPWWPAALVAISLILPLAGLFFCGLLVGTRRPLAAALVAVAAAAGWLVWGVGPWAPLARI